VVDTGIHALGWARDQAVDFFVQRTGKPGHDVEVEIDRYIVWPAQALAYTVGALTIKRLRADAEAEWARVREEAAQELELAARLRTAAEEDTMHRRESAQRVLDIALAARAEAEREASELLAFVERESIKTSEALRQNLDAARELRAQAARALARSEQASQQELVAVQELRQAAEMEVAQIRAAIHRELESATEVRAAAAEEAAQLREEAQRELDAARELRAAASREAHELLAVAERQSVEMRDAARHSVVNVREGWVQVAHNFGALPETFTAPHGEVQVAEQPEGGAEHRHYGNGGEPAPFETWDPGPIGWEEAPSAGAEGQIEPPDLLPEASDAQAGDEGGALSPP
jgi:hypothetical protein